MIQYRKGEERQTRFRADRIFTVGDNYYFNTRENKEVGPFTSRSSAQSGVALYIKHIEDQEEAEKYASKIATQGLWASTNYS